MADVAFSTAPPPAPPQAVTGVSPEMLHYQRLMALAMMKDGSSYAPLQSWTQGLARATNGIMGGLEARWDAEKEMQGRQQAANDSAAMFGLPQTAIPAMPDSPFGYVTRGLGMDGGGAPAAAPASAPSAGLSAGPTGKGLLGALLANESGNRNIDNTTQGTSSGQAQGNFQITTGTWNDFAPKAGVNLAQYPTPHSAPWAVQAQVASGIPLGRWDNSTLSAIRNAGYSVNPNATLGDNVKATGGSFNAYAPAGQRADAGDMAAPTTQTAGLSLPPGKTGFGSIVDQPAPSLVGATPEVQAFAAAHPPVPAPTPVTGPGPQGPLAGDFGSMNSAVGPQPAPVVPSTGPLPGDAPMALAGLGAPAAPVGPGDLGGAMPPPAPVAPMVAPTPGPDTAALLATLGAGSAPQAPGPMDPSIAAYAGMPPAPVPSPTLASDGNAVPPPPPVVAMDQPGPVPAPGVPLPPVRPTDLGLTGANAGPVAAPLPPPANARAALAQALMNTPSGRNSMNQSPTAFNVSQALPPAQAAIASALAGRSTPPVAPAPSAAVAPPGAPVPSSSGSSPGVTSVTGALAGNAPAAATGAAAPSPGAGAMSPNAGRLMALLGNPWASEGQKSVASALLQREIAPQYDFQQRPDGSILAINKLDPTQNRVAAGPMKTNNFVEGPTDPDTGYQTRLYGNPIDGYHRVNPDGTVQGPPNAPAPGTTTTPAAPGAAATTLPPPPPPGVDPKRWREEMATRGAQEASPNATNELDFSQKMMDRPSYKEISTIVPNYNAMIKLMQDNTAGGVKAFIDAYGRVINPGASVRQGTFQMLQDSQSLPEQIKQEILKKYEGGAELSPNALAAMASAAKDKVTSFKEAWDKDVEQGTKVAGAHHLKVENVIPQLPDIVPLDLSHIASRKTEAQPTPAVPTTGAPVVVPGVTHTWTPNGGLQPVRP